MALTVSDIQSRIASIVDQDSTAPTEGGDDWNLRLEFMNMAQRDWAETFKWQTLYKEFNTLATQSTGNTSIALPEDFRQLTSYPRITADGTNTADYTEIKPQSKDQYSGSDKYIYILGNPEDGYFMKVQTGRAPNVLVSGASVYVPYLAVPGSLASPTDKSQIQDPQYLVARTVAYLWESREDARFPQQKAEADKILAKMVVNENVHNVASAYGEVRTVEETRHNFRWGRNS